MADFVLADGKATAIREDGGTQEGFVDLDIDRLSEEPAPAGTDHLVMQRGSDDPAKVLLGAVRGGYDTLWVPAAAMTPAGTDGAMAQAKEYATTPLTHHVMTFAGAVNDTHAEFDIVMPPSWDRAAVKAKVYWTAGTDANANEHVAFYIAAGARGDDGALDAALGAAVNIADQFVAADDLHVTPASAELAVTGAAQPSAGEQFIYGDEQEGISWKWDANGVSLGAQGWSNGSVVSDRQHSQFDRIASINGAVSFIWVDSVSEGFTAVEWQAILDDWSGWEPGFVDAGGFAIELEEAGLGLPEGGGPPTLGDLIHVKLSRDYDHDGGGTAMDVDAHVLGVLIQYKKALDVAAW